MFGTSRWPPWCRCRCRGRPPSDCVLILAVPTRDAPGLRYRQRRRRVRVLPGLQFLPVQSGRRGALLLPKAIPHDDSGRRTKLVGCLRRRFRYVIFFSLLQHTRCWVGYVVGVTRAFWKCRGSMAGGRWKCSSHSVPVGINYRVSIEVWGKYGEAVARFFFFYFFSS